MKNFKKEIGLPVEEFCFAIPVLLYHTQNLFGRLFGRLSLVIPGLLRFCWVLGFLKRKFSTITVSLY